jgi:hypothetical protein
MCGLLQENVRIIFELSDQMTRVFLLLDVLLWCFLEQSVRYLTKCVKDGELLDLSDFGYQSLARGFARFD